MCDLRHSTMCCCQEWNSKKYGSLMSVSHVELFLFYLMVINTNSWFCYRAHRTLWKISSNHTNHQELVIWRQQIKYNKTVCIFHGICCRIMFVVVNFDALAQASWYSNRKETSYLPLLNAGFETRVSYTKSPADKTVCIFHGIYCRPDSKVHGANMGPTWVLSAPDGPHVGPMKLAIREDYECVYCMKELAADIVLWQHVGNTQYCRIVWNIFVIMIKQE